MGAFIPNYLQTFHGVDVTISLILNGCFLIISALVLTFLGPQTDTWGGDRCTIFGHFVCAIGASIFALAPDNTPYGWNLIGGTLLMAGAQGLLNSAVYKWSSNIWEKRSAQIGGVVGFIGALGGFFIPIALSLLGGGSKSMFLFTGMHVIMAVLSIVLKISEDNREKVITKSKAFFAK
jgi:NNP family nitrate/nitrite transporter-like MFS transporter